ncbi:MAG TPA: RNA methyltransferase [Ignavibacteria bacterium]|nr:RNA methyltransferase [Ignavibacteria bacterium]HQY53072.1 RNA methyltransferase [Ignavibacteria bacterium]HRB01113.1 RNA methyltransferase [Ignavibacteria bacterium]
MRKLTHSEIEKSRKKPEEILNYKRNPVYVLCDNIRSIFNVGAIFRTSDAAFVEKIYLTGYTPYPPRKEIEKVALGATETVPWEYYKDPVEIVLNLKKENIKIAVLEITDEQNLIWNVKPADFPLCLVLGNEITGVSKEIIDLADMSFEIPMLGMKQSLNVSVAYGVAVFEMVKKIQFNKE